MTPTVRPIRRSDLPPEFTETVRGWAIELDGQVIGTAGIIYTDFLQAFSRMEPALAKYPKVIVKVGKKLAELCSRVSGSVYAYADPDHPKSTEFLEHLGFVEDQGIYRWAKQLKVQVKS